ncbi:hypothetical protein CBF97_09480, partial [Streptococcus pyogenes]
TPGFPLWGKGPKFSPGNFPGKIWGFKPKGPLLNYLRSYLLFLACCLSKTPGFSPLGKRGPKIFPGENFPRGKFWGFKTPKGAPFKTPGVLKTPGFSPFWGKGAPKFSPGKFPRGKFGVLNPKGPFKPRGLKPRVSPFGEKGPQNFPGKISPGKFGV